MRLSVACLPFSLPVLQDVLSFPSSDAMLYKFLLNVHLHAVAFPTAFAQFLVKLCLSYLKVLLIHRPDPVASSVFTEGVGFQQDTLPMSPSALE